MQSGQLSRFDDVKFAEPEVKTADGYRAKFNLARRNPDGLGV